MKQNLILSLSIVAFMLLLGCSNPSKDASEFLTSSSLFNENDIFSELNKTMDKAKSLEEKYNVTKEPQAISIKLSRKLTIKISFTTTGSEITGISYNYMLKSPDEEVKDEIKSIIEKYLDKKYIFDAQSNKYKIKDKKNIEINIFRGPDYIRYEYKHSIYVGNDNDGGIIFYVDSTNKQGVMAAKSDISNGTTWDEAQTLCKQYGKGWRLPTWEEFNKMVKCQFLQVGDYNRHYWTGDEANADFAYQYKFFEGNTKELLGKNYDGYVRCVRCADLEAFEEARLKDSTDNVSKIFVGKEYNGGIIFYVDSTGEHGLLTTISDTIQGITWHKATALAKKIGDGWRLPTKDELKKLSEQNKIIKNLRAHDYWSSSVQLDKYGSRAMDIGFTVSLGSGDDYYCHLDTDYPYVRFVKPF